jgi:alanyl-tRNA synthetase
MTDRLYYTDSYLTRFDATVAAAAIGAGGRHEIVLDRTAFYPTSGGQPFDVGTLGGARVVDVVDADDGRVVHVTDAPLSPGASVEGDVDWNRRFDHMQQHTGQHLLSAAFDRRFGVRTESFHLGSDGCSIDLAREVTPAEMSAAVDEANRVVWEDRPVRVRFVTPEEAAALPLRKEPVKPGRLRLIDIHDYDLSACGGTHVARTGSVGIVVVAGWERVRGGSRVEFLCGGRARRRFDDWRDALLSARRLLPVAPGELAAGIERLQSENRSRQKALAAAHERLAAADAHALVEHGLRIGNRLVVAETLPDRDAVGLKSLASAVAAESGAVAALFSSATPALVVVACHPAAGVDAAAVLKSLTATFGGRGGGKPDLAQGGGLQGTTDALVTAARQLLSR